MSKRVALSFATTFCAALLMSVCTASAAHEGYAPNPAYAAWKTFKIGTSVRIENDADPRIIRFKTAKLVAIDAESVTVEYTDGTVTRDGKDESKPEQYKIPVEKYVGTTTSRPSGTITEGDEEMTVAGRKIHAHWVKRVVSDYDPREKSNVVITETRWTSDQVPGGEVMEKSSAESNNRVKEYSWKIVEIKEP